MRFRRLAARRPSIAETEPPADSGTAPASAEALADDAATNGTPPAADLEPATAGAEPAAADLEPATADGRPMYRRVAAAVLTTLACAFVLFGLVAPARLGLLTPAAFLSIPLEGIIAVSLLLVLPMRVGRWVAGSLGALLGLLTIMKILDMGFYEAFARTFDPMTDW